MQKKHFVSKWKSICGTSIYTTKSEKIKCLVFLVMDSCLNFCTTEFLYVITYCIMNACKFNVLSTLSTVNDGHKAHNSPPNTQQISLYTKMPLNRVVTDKNVLNTHQRVCVCVCVCTTLQELSALLYFNAKRNAGNLKHVPTAKWQIQ